MSAHLIALIVSLRTRIPWVADFRDPWRGNPFRVIESKSLNAWDALLEWCVLRRASHVIGNTPTMTRALCRRRPFVMGKCSTILNGVDVERIARIGPRRIAPRDEFVLVHCGQFYGPRSPQPWFAALARLFRDSPVLRDRIRVVLIGPDQYDGVPLTDLATRADIGDRVSVLGMKSHDEALAYMKGGDALMLPGVDGPGGDLQVPGKLYEYLACGKPIIATITPGSPVVDIIRKAGGVAITCPIHDTAALAEAIRHVVTGGLAFATTPARIEVFDRSRTAKQLATIFHKLSKRPLRSDPVVTATRTAPIETITGRVSRENRNVTDSSFGVVSSATTPGKSG